MTSRHPVALIRGLCITLPCLVAACGSSPPPAAAPDGWAVFDAPESGQANHWHVVDGEFVGTDEIHFARGANADGLYHEQYYAPGGVPPEPQPAPVEDDDVYRHATWGAFGTDRAAHNGDYLLPTDRQRWPDFTADLGLLRLEATATDLFVQLRFVSFPDPLAQIATLTLSRVDAEPPLRDWPRNAGVRSRYEYALTVSGQRVLLHGPDDAEQDLIALGGELRTSDHAYELRVPLSALPPGPWWIGVGSGLADPAAPDRYWTVPAGAPGPDAPGTDSDQAPGANVWDLMFTPHDRQWHDDHLQSTLLADGDVSAARVRVDPAQLQQRASVSAPRYSGRVAHTYLSAFDFGDGIVRGAPGTPPVPPPPTAPTVRPRDPAVNYEYTGRMQPYFAYIPSAYENSDHDWPLILYFHGLNNYIWEPFGLMLGLEQALEDRGYLFASLLGRGDLFFEGRGELDPLEVVAHMRARYRIDPARIYLIGHSHGAAGVLNVARRNPELFAAVVSGQIGESPKQPGNFMYLPSLHIAGAQDPIDGGDAARRRYRALSDLGYDVQLLIYQAKTHENSSLHDALPMILDLFDRTRTPADPPVVEFTRGGGDLDESLGLRHDRAWWVQDLVAVDPAQDLHVRAESFAIEHQTRDPAAATRREDQLVDTGGPSGRSIALYSVTEPDPGVPAPVSRRARVSLSNVAALALDLDRMGLAPGDGALELELPAATVLNLRLRSATATALDWLALDADGRELARGRSRRQPGGFTLELPAGSQRLQVRAAP